MDSDDNDNSNGYIGLISSIARAYVYGISTVLGTDDSDDDNE